MVSGSPSGTEKIGCGVSKPAAKQKIFLFLQGPPSIFARTIADELELLGCKALRINLCPGDWLSWHDKRARSYCGTLAEWPKWLSKFCQANGVTDLVYYADRVPYHSAAAEVGNSLGLTCTTYEFGYLRPDWITLERDGMSAHSRFPKDPDIIREAAASLPEIDRRPLFPFSFETEAVSEVTYNMSNVLFVGFYPCYTRDKLYHPFIDYLNNIPRLLLSRRRARNAAHLIDDVISSGCPYFVFPLQLQSDYQLRYNSQFSHIAEAAEEVVRSFAKAAPIASRLVFKVHPLDNGMEPWRKILRTIAKRYGVKKRVYVIDGGNLNQLLQHSAGALTINSTTGLHSLRVSCPTKVLGIALYDIDGLTCQKPIDDFWRDGSKPDPELLDALERLLAATIQVKGCFYTDKGRRAGAYEIARRLAAGSVNLPGALCDVAPRLKRARDLGIATTFDEQIASRGKTERWTHVWQG
ncbi:capsular biosynthesis protein [uncultured Roseibium sp.]|uniref:capsule biosynthesis protein n=1 Tax=uncultured Roseibium sp. TaxID=1936171 RepID=UPI0025950EFC|nr:capsular biosynthesis protein [uncultured Roseibium sp.]